MPRVRWGFRKKNENIFTNKKSNDVICGEKVREREKKVKMFEQKLWLNGTEKNGRW